MSLDSVRPTKAHAQFTSVRRVSSYLSYRGDQPETLFDRLPLELQAEVFSHCLPAYPALGDNEDPMAIAQVCRAWRLLAYATPRLWSSFEIEVQDWSTNDVADELPNSIRILSRAKLWLERSKAQPLSFRLLHLPTGRVPNPLSGRLLALLASQSRRWSHIELMVPSPTLVSVQHLLPEDFPTIKTMTLHMKGVWNSVRFDFRGGVLGVPFMAGNQLTELDLRLDHNHLLNLDDCAELLSSATNLKACRINADCTMTRSSSRSTGRDRLELPSLRHLHLILQGGIAGEAPPPTIPQTSMSSTMLLAPEPSLIAFLELFSDCALTHFGVNWLVDGDRTNHWTSSMQVGFTSFLTDLSPSLRSLEVTYLPLGEDGVLQCLALLPTLEDLDLRFSLADQRNDPISDRVLKALVVSPSPKPSEGARRRSPSPSQSESKPLVPALRKLHLQCTGSRCTESVLLAMVESRTRTGDGSLRQLGFYSMHQVLSTSHLRVKEWSHAGLHATIDSVVLL